VEFTMTGHSDVPDFVAALRGYGRSQVDDIIRRLSAEERAHVRGLNA